MGSRVGCRVQIEPVRGLTGQVSLFVMAFRTRAKGLPLHLLPGHAPILDVCSIEGQNGGLRGAGQPHCFWRVKWTARRDREERRVLALSGRFQRVRGRSCGRDGEWRRLSVRRTWRGGPCRKSLWVSGICDAGSRTARRGDGPLTENPAWVSRAS